MTALLIRILGNKIKTVSLLFGEPYMIQLIPLVPARPLTHTGVETHTNTQTHWFLRELKRISASNHEGDSVTIIRQPVKNIKSSWTQQRVVLTTAAAEMSSVKLFFSLIDLMCGFGFPLSAFLSFFMTVILNVLHLVILFFPFCVIYTREWNWGLHGVQHFRGKFLI